MVFICLITVNLQMRSNFASWPPPGVDSLDRILPTVATIGLIISGVLAGRGLNAIRADDHKGLVTNWAIALALGVCFVAIMGLEFIAVPFSGQYSTVFRVMTAFHGIHALVIGLIMWRVFRNASAGAYDASHQWAVEGTAKLWYFVVVAWILFYIVLYII